MTTAAEVLAAEHAAIYAYGVIGAHLTGAAATAARDAEAAHRARRDALGRQVIAAGATPTPADPAYALPFPVTDQASALRLAVQTEERTGAVWRSALATTSGDERQAALDALVDCAIRATRFRRAAGVTPATVTFPGRPG
ncbi:MAG: ferritin-like domain-containing protein [Micromonosporaceae bacterium]|nr:ferritin-like domain-containing protein [Micromonosporaceae bacterium]